MYKSTCFGRPHAHHEELNNCSSSRWFYRWSVVVAVLLVVVGAGRPDHDQQHCYQHAPTVKPEAATAVVELLMMGVRKPETCRAVHKRQVINLRNCSSSWLIYLNCMMMHGLANFKWVFMIVILYLSINSETSLISFYTF
jgi:hypothetical protein